MSFKICPSLSLVMRQLDLERSLIELITNLEFFVLSLTFHYLGPSFLYGTSQDYLSTLKIQRKKLQPETTMS